MNLAAIGTGEGCLASRVATWTGRVGIQPRFDFGALDLADLEVEKLCRSVAQQGKDHASGERPKQEVVGAGELPNELDPGWTAESPVSHLVNLR